MSQCSLRVEPGRFSVIIGPSGAGKSTLVRLIAGFEAPTSGEIRIGGKPVRGPGKDRQVVFQETALFPWMTTAGNVSYGPRVRGEFGAEAKRFAEALTARMGLERFAQTFPAQLSGGMQRRAELARAMMNEPSVMILDEPFRGLDSMTKRLMLEYYATFSAESQRTNLFVTTDVDEAIFLGDRIFVMSHIPMRVRAVVDVDVPRPRRLAAFVDDERVNELKAELLALLHEEAARAFAAGGKETADFVEAYRRHHSSPPSGEGRPQ